MPWRGKRQHSGSRKWSQKPWAGERQRMPACNRAPLAEMGMLCELIKLQNRLIDPPATTKSSGSPQRH
jgi:hypothetical protein